jgi:hypothetical protein
MMQRQRAVVSKATIVRNPYPVAFFMPCLYQNPFPATLSAGSGLLRNKLLNRFYQFQLNQTEW